MRTSRNERGISVDWRGVDELCNFDARFVAMDKDGKWFAYASEPLLSNTHKNWQSTPMMSACPFVIGPDESIGWMHTLVERPINLKAGISGDTGNIVVDWDGLDAHCVDGGFAPAAVAMCAEGGWHAYKTVPSLDMHMRLWRGEALCFAGRYIEGDGGVVWCGSLVIRPVTPATTDPVNHPSHYTQGGVETIVAISSIVAGYTGHAAYCAGNVVKYVARAPFKGALVEDLRKAQWYLDALIKEVEK